MTHRASSRLRALGALAAIASALLALVSVDLPGPALQEPGTWRLWLDRTDPLDVGAAGARAVAAVLLAYLLLVSLLQLIALSRPSRLREVADALTPRFVSAFLATAVLTASPVAASVAGDPPADDDDAVITMEVVEPEVPAALPVEPPAEPTALMRTARDEEYVVVAGDNLWRIAERTLERRRGLELPSADLVEVADYWVLLTEANRARLHDPRNPDLIHPGQRLLLP